MTTIMHPGENDPPVPLNVRWVARIALGVAATAATILLLMVYLITDDSGVDYPHVIFTHSVTLHGLRPAIVAFGLLMIVIAAIATWFIALYSSFRIAGPLFRFSQNLKSIIDDAFAVPMAIRSTDMLQNEWNTFDASQARLREHYGALRQALEQCQAAVRTHSEADLEPLRQALARLQEVERRVQL